MSTKPVLFVHERYEPRTCVSDQCPHLPVVTYVAATDGVLLGRQRLAGQMLYVCAIHDREASNAVGD